MTIYRWNENLWEIFFPKRLATLSSLPQVLLTMWLWQFSHWEMKCMFPPLDSGQIFTTGQIMLSDFWSLIVQSGTSLSLFPSPWKSDIMMWRNPKNFWWGARGKELLLQLLDFSRAPQSVWTSPPKSWLSLYIIRICSPNEFLINSTDMWTK